MNRTANAQTSGGYQTKPRQMYNTYRSMEQPEEIKLPWQKAPVSGGVVTKFEDYTNIHKLKDTWTLWFHNSESNDWTLNGYQELLDISSIEEFWLVFNKIEDFTTGMYFLMRKGHIPIWEDYQKPVHFVKYITVKSNYLSQWLNLCLSAIGETTCPSDSQEQLFGVSISPKYKTLIIRLWTFQSTMPTLNPRLKVPLDKCVFT